MVRCKICNAPLTGFLSIIGKTVFNVKPSSHNPQICNKCIDKEIESNKTHSPEKIKNKSYKCQICNRIIHEEHALEHVKTEEYLIELIKKNHPQWHHKEPTCRECIDYYRKLIKDAEI
jgi:hypothetical protein